MIPCDTLELFILIGKIKIARQEDYANVKEEKPLLPSLSFPESLMNELVDAGCNDSEDVEVRLIRHIDAWKQGIGGDEPC